MAVMPGAHYLNAAQGSPMARFDIVCIHTIVGYAPANAAHFSTPASGYLWQSRDTRYRSAANLTGNPRVIAIENEDHGPAYGAWSGSNVPRFTAAQIETIAKVCAWAYQTHGIPLVLCPNSKPGSRGIAYHREGIDGNFGSFAYPGRVAGGELWSSSTGKICPGDRRITQLITQIIPRARQLAGLEEDTNMATVDQIASVLDGYYTARKAKYGDQDGHDLGKAIFDIEEVLGDAFEDTALTIGTQVKQIRDTVAGVAKGLTDLGAKVDQIALAGIDVSALAVALTPLLGNDLDRRARDGDPTTGPVS